MNDLKEWLELNTYVYPTYQVTEKVIESGMGFIFARCTTNNDGTYSESMVHVQSNYVQFKWFLERRMADKQKLQNFLKSYRKRFI